MNITTTVPREVIYYEFVPMPTSDRGTVYMCIAMDHASGFVFNLGFSEELTDQAILDKLKELMNNTEFKKQSRAFKVFTYRAPHLEEQMNSILKPHKGSVTFSEEIVAEGILPFLEKILG